MTTDPVRQRLLNIRDALHELTAQNDAAISEYDRRDDLRLDLEQDERDAYHARLQELRAESDELIYGRRRV